MSESDLKSLSQRTRSLWEQGIDTQAMSCALQVSENDCERALHAALDIRHAIVNSLGRKAGA